MFASETGAAGRAGVLAAGGSVVPSTWRGGGAAPVT